MRWRFVIFKILLLTVLLPIATMRPAAAFGQEKDGGWAKILIPEGGTLQYAGNIGMFSVGPAWFYGKNNRWETEFLVGFVPRENGVKGAATFSFRENLAPWNIDLKQLSFAKTSASLVPAYFDVSCNIITGQSFWHTHHKNGKNHFDYYQFSSKARIGFGAGSRLSLASPQLEKIHLKKVSLYYELTTYDLAIRNAICNKSVGLFDILALGVGVQVRFL